MTEDRAPIWTIPSGEATAFFAYFTTLNILGLCFVGWHEHLTNQTQGILNIIREVIADAGSVTVRIQAGIRYHSIRVHEVDNGSRQTSSGEKFLDTPAGEIP